MLARALVGDPNVLIVDEPISGLDPKHALDTAQRLQGLAQDGKLVIASLHDLTLAGRYASRIFALVNGCVQGDGPTADDADAHLDTLGIRCGRAYFRKPWQCLCGLCGASQT